MGNVPTRDFKVGGLQAQGFPGAHLTAAGLSPPLAISWLRSFLVGFVAGQTGLQTTAGWSPGALGFHHPHS